MIIDGKIIAVRKLEELRLKIRDLKVKPYLAIILVGEDPSSVTYTNLKKKRGEEVGIDVEVIKFAQDVAVDDMITRIQELNNDTAVSGILVQLPLPAGLGEGKILTVVDPGKDVDGLTGRASFLPATVKGIVTLLDETKATGQELEEWLKNKKVTVIGQGKLIGKPLADYLERNGAKVWRCDRQTSEAELKQESREADILVSATGTEGIVSADMVKPGAIVIDCGSPKAEVDFEKVKDVAGAITPVPGGVGPMTVVSLLENTVEAATRMSNGQ